MAGKADRRRFGLVRQLPNKRWQSSYPDPGGATTLTAHGNTRVVRHSSTFDTKADAEEWLSHEKKLQEKAKRTGKWTPPKERIAKQREKAAKKRVNEPTLGEYAPRWLAARKVKGRPLAERTKDHYADLLDRFILPTFGESTLREISPERVAEWYDTLAVGRPTTQAHAYGLLRAILATAADPTKTSGKPLIPFNPCGIRGGGSAPHKKRPEPPTAAEVAALAATVPPRHRLLVLLADGCALRFGELAELRRGDVDTRRGIIRVRRGVVRTTAGVIAKRPKSEASIRDVPIPPHLLPEVRQHLLEHAAPGAQGLLFPGRASEHLSPSAFYGKPAEVLAGEVTKKGWGWYEARRAIGRPELHFHDLRHGALTEAARNGATLGELMALGGHSTSQAAMLYQSSASTRLAELARKRSEALGWAEEAE